MPPRPPLTHFLCIPLITSSSKSQLLASLQHFTSSLTSISTVLVPEKAIRPLGTLHLTLGVMSHQTKDRLDEALEFLQSLNLQQLLQSTTLLPPADDSSKEPSNPFSTITTTPALAIPNDNTNNPIPPLTISLRGLTPMHNPTSTSILYLSPFDPSSRLYPFCQALQSAFTTAGFLVPDDRPLKLHATVVNTIYAKQKSARRRCGGHGGDSRESGKFDARELIEEWKDWVWAEGVVLERVSICEMGARVVQGREGAGVVYVEVGGVDMPGWRGEGDSGDG
jgi:activating signal cointegrator complex subunit 1